MGTEVLTTHRIAEEWENFLKTKYEHSNDKNLDQFRDYRKEARPSVKEFYRINHENQTYETVLNYKAKYGPKQMKKMGIWEAMEWLNTLVDDSDPDTSLTQIQHLLQTAEAIRRSGLPRWMILTGLIHDLGKILCFFGEPQWAVVGDTFPVGCQFSDKVVFPEFFSKNPDHDSPKYNTKFGVYTENCGLDNVHMSYGHDEYLYNVVKDYLPEEALYIIRYHSFYAAHREGDYQYLMNEKDKKMLGWVHLFNPYDLYTKSDSPPNVEELKPFYLELISEFFPEKIDW